MCHLFLTHSLAVAYLSLASFHCFSTSNLPPPSPSESILCFSSPYQSYTFQGRKLSNLGGTMMVQTLIPCSPASKTEEILSRYRPIAPKPELPASTGDGAAAEEGLQKMKHSPYLRNIWAHLQARPTRTRKRGRSSITPSPTTAASLKRQRLQLKHPYPRAPTPLLGLCCPSHLGFISPLNGLEEKQQVITLPLLSSSPLPMETCHVGVEIETEASIDLNSSAGLEERDLILQLRSPTPWIAPHVIAPKPIRPIGSTIRVEAISNTEGATPRANAEAAMKPGEVEAEAEATQLPTVISDSNNKVRMANSAYKELVGQPECQWLDDLKSVTGRRIGGEVMLQLPAQELPVRHSSSRFSCWVRIEWGNGTEEGKKKESVDAFCDVVRLNCENKDYLFSWRFHTKQATGF